MAPPALSDLAEFKDEVRAHYDRLAPFRDQWYARNQTYYAYLESRLRLLVPPAQSVLELGCGTGNLLAALQPDRALGIDVSPRMIEMAAHKYSRLNFRVDDAESVQSPEPFDYVIASDLVGDLLDIGAMLNRVHALSHGQTRLILTFHNPALEGMLRLAQRVGAAMAPARQNWIGPRDLADILQLGDFTVEHVESGLLLPLPIPLLASVANARLARLPGPRYFNLLNIVVARPVKPRPRPGPLTCTVVIPCRNEVDNIEPAIARVPDLGGHTEILFVDGASTDGTVERIEQLQARHRGHKDIKLLHQTARLSTGAHLERTDPNAPVAMLKLGKGDAVRKGFDVATGDVLMILDADLTVPPEDLPAFFAALATGKADFINGNRLLYPMEERAMKFVNYLGNKFFSVLFTWLLGQRVRDTLCGTKALRKADYLRIKEGRAYFGEFDPFGDFDLLFGAARLKLRIVDVPVRYRRRIAGVTKVRVLKHGWLLLAMSVVAFRKFKLGR
jgi:glycosyltransferase involved in cell wall biosynthesis/ubiquinone/menaquinone biosynthesis C-methylase UbiE